MRLVLLGAPGSGKGTQSAFLAEHFDAPHVSSGELMREHMATGSELGQQVASYVTRGELVPDDLVIAIVGDAIRAAEASRGYVLDGFPRTVAQAERAFTLASPHGLTADAVVYLALPDDVARARLTGRAEGRSDDSDPSIVERRLAVYHESTQPLLDFYRQRGLLVPVDASQAVPAVSRAIIDALECRRG
jgi:adenylate kinase